MFSLICAWMNGWVNNRLAGDIRRHRAHYVVTVMIVTIDVPSPISRHRGNYYGVRPMAPEIQLGISRKWESMIYNIDHSYAPKMYVAGTILTLFHVWHMPVLWCSSYLIITDNHPSVDCTIVDFENVFCSLLDQKHYRIQHHFIAYGSPYNIQPKSFSDRDFSLKNL